jgi:hypothetical protein
MDYHRTPSPQAQGAGGPAWSGRPLGRSAFVAASLLLAFACQYVYVEVLVGDGRFAYMGVVARPVSAAELAGFFALAVAPSLLLPLDARGPSDVIRTFLFAALHVPTLVLLPYVSQSPPAARVLYGVVATCALLVTASTSRLPLPAPATRLPAVGLYWTGVFAVGAVLFVIFARSGQLSWSNVDLLDVYDRRRALAEASSTLGGLFFYAGTWTGGAVAPFLLAAGLQRRAWSVAVGGVALGFLSFVASSNKLNYLILPPVVLAWYLLHRTRGRGFAPILTGLVALGGLAAAFADRWLLNPDGGMPLLTWVTFHRGVTNNGFMSAIYLDVFRDAAPALYGDSFLRRLPGMDRPLPLPEIAGASFSSVAGAFANAGCFADAFANARWLGMLATGLFASIVCWLADAMTRHVPLALSGATLVVAASVMTNTSIHTTLLSNGMAIALVLLWLWPYRASTGNMTAEDASPYA